DYYCQVYDRSAIWVF
nr:immunoglobulin light chain junction region [Macaca mulatta]